MIDQQASLPVTLEASARRTKFSITALMVATLGGLVALSAGAVFLVAMINMSHQTDRILSSRIEALANEVETLAASFLMPVEDISDWLAEEMIQGRLAPDEPVALANAIQFAFGPKPQARYAIFHPSDPTKARIFVDLEDRTWRTAPRDDSLPSPDYLKVDGPKWRVREMPGSEQVRGGRITPVIDGDDDYGVLEVFADVGGLSRIFSEGSDYQGFEVTRFLVTDRRNVIAHSTLLSEGWVGEAPQIPDSGDRVLDKLFLGDVFIPNFFQATGPDEVAIVEVEDAEVGEQEYVAVVRRPFSERSESDVAIGAYLETDAGAADFAAMLQLLAAGLVILALAGVGAVILGRKLASPIREFAEAARTIDEGAIASFTPLEGSRVQEYNDATQSLNRMVERLRDRQRVRELFGRYVPEGVAQLLMRNELADQPKNTTATVLFLDLAGFTSMAQNLSPTEVVATLNAFFSEAVSEIEAEGGMVTQFQGDAILAVFNLPVEQADHAGAAIRAAVRIERSVATNTFAGQTLCCRVGVNTGELVAGAVGATNRLSYTVHGDAVNLAARLEQMNKETGTKLLASETTVSLTPDYPYQEIGSMPVRGRDTAVRVFTIDVNEPGPGVTVTGSNGTAATATAESRAAANTAANAAE